MGTIITRTLADRTKRYDVRWRANGKQESKTFTRRKAADNFLTTVVKRVQDGTYQEVTPILVSQLLDRWLEHSLEVRVKQGLLKPSTAKSYRSMVREHLRPAFGEYRSDRLTPAVIGEWVARMADRIAQKCGVVERGVDGDGQDQREKPEKITPKFYNNVLNLLHAILAWARHPAQGYLAHDPLIGQKRLPKSRVEREFLEPGEIGTAFLFDTALRSDFLFWVAIRLAPQTVIRAILATPPAVVESASTEERARVAQMQDHILPVSPRRLGLLNDAAVTSSLPRYELERIAVPTLILSMADDLFGTYDGARYSAEHIPGARFIGYPSGGHLWVGHQKEVMSEIATFLR